VHESLLNGVAARRERERERERETGRGEGEERSGIMGEGRGSRYGPSIFPTDK